jgi:hypothetical protein
VTQHRYPPAALLGDYLRALAGFALAIAPLLLVQLNSYVAALFALLGVLFVLFALRTVLRQLAPLRMSDAGIASAGPFPVSLAWSGLEDLRLAYFATRRDGKGGWMQLVLRGGGKRLNLDSRIEGFAAVVERAARAAAARHLELNIATTTNLAALGIRLAGMEP